MKGKPPQRFANNKNCEILLFGDIWYFSFRLFWFTALKLVTANSFLVFRECFSHFAIWMQIKTILVIKCRKMINGFGSPMRNESAKKFTQNLLQATIKNCLQSIEFTTMKHQVHQKDLLNFHENDCRKIKLCNFPPRREGRELRGSSFTIMLNVYVAQLLLPLLTSFFSWWVIKKSFASPFFM